VPAYSALDESAQFLKGVGPRRAEALGRVGVHTARDLVFHVPRRYEDASTVTPIDAVRPGTDATCIGTVISKAVMPTRAGLRIFQAVLRDESGSIGCAWPGQPFLDRVLREGDVVLVTGPVRFYHGLQLQPREFVVLSRAGDGGSAKGKVLPIYPATDGLSQKQVRGIIEQNLDRLLPLLTPEDPMPPELIRPLGLPTLMQAVVLLHRPETLRDAERGRRRLAFDELFFLQLLHARARQQSAAERHGLAFVRQDTLLAPLYRSLPFELTGAQTRVIREILADMQSPQRMNRLLQGDVGSGKTVVALFAMALAAENGAQSALMAPTELLAEQHYRTIGRMLEPVGLAPVLLTGRLPAAERRTVREAMASGAAPIAVGTHALIQEGVTFRNLGLAIIDEQHRFGVRQRLALGSMGAAADVLVMSATPIPRSLALTLYGDLELSVIDELPPNRQQVRTVVRPERARAKVYDFIRAQVAAGRQAYVVYPLVEDSDRVEARAATAEFERLRTDEFPQLRLGLLHGQLGGDEKEAVMKAFAAGEIDVLVATTVIEVGIDVPNATVMVIEHGERFGLSQLHQLRGRVGRGAERSFCIVVAPEAGSERLRLFESTNDGFAIARADLQLRGMGDFFGARQHGLPEFRFFRPDTDDDLLEHARDSARGMLDADPQLTEPAHRRLATVLDSRFAERVRLFDTG
jgi:ATP-dependent DNA helicase RecG